MERVVGDLPDPVAVARQLQKSLRLLQGPIGGRKAQGDAGGGSGGERESLIQQPEEKAAGFDMLNNAHHLIARRAVLGLDELTSTEQVCVCP